MSSPQDRERLERERHRLVLAKSDMKQAAIAADHLAELGSQMNGDVERVLPSRRTPPSTERARTELVHADLRMEPLWSPWLQPVAINRKSCGRKSRRNKRHPLSPAATGCRRRYMVRRSVAGASGR